KKNKDLQFAPAMSNRAHRPRLEGLLERKARRSILFFGLCVALQLSSHAQFWQWSTHFGGGGHDQGYIGAVDQAGNVYSFGYYAGAGPWEYQDMYIGNDTLHGSGSFVAKHDAQGNYLWSVNCVAPSAGLGVAALVLDTVNNVLIIAGGHNRSGMIGTFQLPDSGAFLAWISTDGVCLNAQNIGSPHTAIWTMLLHNDGDIYVGGTTGETQSALVGGQTIQPGSFLARLHTHGTFLWARNMIVGFSSQTVRYFPVQILSTGTDLVVYGSATQLPNPGTFDMDTVHVALPHGGGAAMIGVDAGTGIAQWIRPVGFSDQFGFSSRFKHSVAVDTEGQVYCALTVWGDTARFLPDTAISIPEGHGLSFLVKYGSQGNLISLRTFGQDLGLSALDIEESHTLLMMASFDDTSAVDVCSASDGLWLLRTDTLGNCLGSVLVALNTPPWLDDAIGLSIQSTPSGIYLSAASPYSPQYSTINFAGESVTSIGWEDVLLAKCDLSLGVQSLSLNGNDGLSIYANPNQGSFKIDVPDALVNSPNLELRIYDATGRLVLVQPMGGDDHPQFNLFDIGSGFYAVTLSNGQRVYHGNMVVE
ncbi:MAG: T9SS type A sorting domain-containing protein, partial [Flavobacteriales bacterium]